LIPIQTNCSLTGWNLLLRECIFDIKFIANNMKDQQHILFVAILLLMALIFEVQEYKY